MDFLIHILFECRDLLYALMFFHSSISKGCDDALKGKILSQSSSIIGFEVTVIVLEVQS